MKDEALDVPTRAECCGETLHWLIAEASSGRFLVLRVSAGVPVRLWRCRRCERVTTEGWCPPSWGNAVADSIYTLGFEIQAEVEQAYAPEDEGA